MIGTSGLVAPAVIAVQPCTPSPFHLHYTRFISPKYEGVQRWLYVTPPSQRGANRTNVNQSMSFTTSVAQTISVTTGVSFEVDVNAIVASAKVSTSLSVQNSIERGQQFTLTNVVAPRTEGWVQWKAPIYVFSGTLQSIDATCKVITSSRATRVTIPGKPEPVWSSRRL